MCPKLASLEVLGCISDAKLLSDKRTVSWREVKLGEDSYTSSDTGSAFRKLELPRNLSHVKAMDRGCVPQMLVPCDRFHKPLRSWHTHHDAHDHLSCFPSRRTTCLVACHSGTSFLANRRCRALYVNAAAVDGVRASHLSLLDICFRSVFVVLRTVACVTLQHFSNPLTGRQNLCS